MAYESEVDILRNAWDGAGALYAGPRLDLVPVTLTLNTSQYADGDVLAAPQEIAGAVRLNGGRAVLNNLIVLDESDQGAALDIFFCQSTQDVGNENAAFAPTDAEAGDIQAYIVVAAADFIDLGDSRIARKGPTDAGMSAILEAASSSTSLWVGAVSRGTGTYGATAIKLKIGLVQE